MAIRALIELLMADIAGSIDAVVPPTQLAPGLPCGTMATMASSSSSAQRREKKSEHAFERRRGGAGLSLLHFMAFRTSAILIQSSGSALFLNVYKWGPYT